MADSVVSLLCMMFAMGFMASLHCVGMCGGLLAALSMSSKRVRWIGLMTYQLGRVTSYAALGLLLGTLGESLNSFGGDVVQQVLAVFAGLLMLLFALNLIGLMPDPVKHLSRWFTYKIGLMQLISQLAAHARLRGWYMLGLANGLLPCGLVYAALAMGLASGQAFHASMMMLAFGLGTIPAMMFVPVILQEMSSHWRLAVMRVAALLMFSLGVLTISRAMHTMQHVM